jgi:prepilin-type N-terminal cleavage/methylation domain-containing protein
MNAIVPSDAGFSLLEMLAALAIASFVVLSIGGLLLIGVHLRDRDLESTKVATSLLELQTLFLLTGGDLDRQIDGARDNGFALVPHSGQSVAHPLRLDLAANAESRALEFVGIDETGVIDLTAFNAVSLQYLTLGAQSPHWVRAAELAAMAPIAARLILKLNQRVWRPLVWVASSRVLPTLAIGGAT